MHGVVCVCVSQNWSNYRKIIISQLSNLIFFIIIKMHLFLPSHRNKRTKVTSGHTWLFFTPDFALLLCDVGPCRIAPLPSLVIHESVFVCFSLIFNSFILHIFLQWLSFASCNFKCWRKSPKFYRFSHFPHGAYNLSKRWMLMIP